MPSTNPTQHTPGPWTWHADVDEYTIEAESGAVLATIHAVCDPRAGDRANARLIAAAPLLLEALEAYVKAYEHIGHWCWPSDPKNPHNVLDQARHAIRAARGSSTLDSGGVPGGLKS